MNTCLVFSFLVVLLGLTWAQGIKPQFSIDKKNCPQSADSNLATKQYRILRYCDRFENPALCVVECPVAPFYITKYCSMFHDPKACAKRFYFPYPPKKLECPSSRDTTDVMNYCKRFPFPAFCMRDCTHLYREQMKRYYYHT